MKLLLEDDRHCFVCGKDNPSGLKLNFKLENNKLTTEFIPKKTHQGFKDIVHGGIIGLILDEVMLNLLWKLNKSAVTAELKYRLKNPARVGEKLLFEGWIVKENNRIIFTGARAQNERGKIVAQAQAKCMKING